MDDNKDNGFYENNKLLVWILIIILVFVAGYLLINRNRGNNNSDIDEKIDITIRPENVKEVSLGNSINLEAVVSNHPQASIIWSSDDPKIAEVNNGTVTGINYGKTTIVASYYDKNNNMYHAKKEITVSEGNASVPLQKVEFKAGDLYMPVNSTYKLSLIITPSNAYIENKKFSVGDGLGDDKVATVTNDGVVTSLGEGHTRVIVDINNGKFKRAIDVYVSNEYKKANIVLSPTSLSFNSNKIKIKNGKSENLVYSISPSNADKAYLNWISSDESIVQVDNSGKITAKRVGEAIVSVSSLNGKRDDVVVSVESDVIEVKDISLSIQSINMVAGSTQEIIPIVSPSNASNKSLSFNVGDNMVASVVPNADGTRATISALKEGVTTVLIRSSNNIEKYLTINVTGNNNGNNDIDDEDDQSYDLETTIKVRSDKNNLAKTYNEVVGIPVPGISTVSVSLSVGVGKIKYCVQKYGISTNCTPNIDMYSNNSIEISSGDIYVIRIKKYDYRGNEIKSTSDNYIDGVLHYYINTLGDTYGYSVEGAYDDVLEAMNNSLSSQTVKIMIKNSNTSYVKYCYTNEVNCNPSKITYSTANFTINVDGLWRIIIDEYDKNGLLIGKSSVRYVNISNSNLKVAIIPTAENYCRDVVYMGASVIITKGVGEGFYFTNNVYNAPGTYPITAILKDGYIWSDGTKTNKIFYCTLKSN